MIDPHRLFVETVATMLRRSTPPFNVLTAGSLRELRQHDGVAIDVAMIEWRLPDADAVAAIRTVRSVAPRARVALLADDLEPWQIARCRDAGYDAVLNKRMRSAEFLRVLESISSGEHVEAPVAGGDDAGDHLTEREVEVLRCAAAGLSNAQIADTLFLSENTVRNHLQRAARKLGAANRVMSVMQGIRLGYLDLPSDRASQRVGRN
jgi:DNA-binding NarL/FixJ family response regulator